MEPVRLSSGKLKPVEILSMIIYTQYHKRLFPFGFRR